MVKVHLNISQIAKTFDFGRIDCHPAPLLVLGSTKIGDHIMLDGVYAYISKPVLNV